MTNARIRTRDMMHIALFATAIAIASQIMFTLPMAPLVPINMALLAVYLTGALMEMKHSCLAVLVYLLLGAVGVPVFAGLKGGPQALLGHTGGFLIGYLLCVLAIGLLRGAWRGTFAGRCAMFALGLLLCYAFGTAWFMHKTGHSLSVSLGYCVWPFLPGDLAKIALAATLTPRLEKAMKH
ncbi:MAG: biotin transporter BioY [Christensenellales bacterium]|jgi:biotin transport system substrate-specific component